LLVRSPGFLRTGLHAGPNVGLELPKKVFTSRVR
jgi:hypothetical protein